MDRYRWKKKKIRLVFLVLNCYTLRFMHDTHVYVYDYISTHAYRYIYTQRKTILYVNTDVSEIRIRD